MFVIEDEWHAEPLKGEFNTLEDAMNELRRLAKISWDQQPNLAPCTGWRHCGRKWEIIEYDASVTPWKLLSKNPVLEIDADGIRWLSN